MVWSNDPPENHYRTLLFRGVTMATPFEVMHAKCACGMDFQSGGMYPWKMMDEQLRWQMIQCFFAGFFCAWHPPGCPPNPSFLLYSVLPDEHSTPRFLSFLFANQGSVLWNALNLTSKWPDTPSDLDLPFKALPALQSHYAVINQCILSHAHNLIEPSVLSFQALTQMEARPRALRNLPMRSPMSRTSATMTCIQGARRWISGETRRTFVQVLDIILRREGKLQSLIAIALYQLLGKKLISWSSKPFQTKAVDAGGM